MASAKRALAALALVGGVAMLPARDVTPSFDEAWRAAPEVNSIKALCSARNAAGAGLRGEYFTQRDWRGAPALTRIDPVIDFDGSVDWPSASPGPRSVRWRGWIKAPITGAYRFHVDVPGAHVRVARQDVLMDTTSATVVLEATRFYPIEVDVGELDAADVRPLRLEWTAPHGVRYLVPRSLLFLPTETVGQRTTTTVTNG